jgi:hypothetical protein
LGARFSYVVFWTTCLITTTLVFALTGVAVDVAGGRYLLAGYIAIGALLPLLATRGPGWRLAVTAGVCVFALSAIYEARQQSFAVTPPTPSPLQANQLLRYAQKERVTYGYGAYEDALPLTWMMRFKLQVYPVYECAPASHGLCLIPNTAHISTWYATPGGARSLLIVDPSQNAPTVTGADTAFGTPIASTMIGDFSVYVYPYNLDTKLQG